MVTAILILTNPCERKTVGLIVLDYWFAIEGVII